MSTSNFGGKMAAIFSGSRNYIQLSQRSISNSNRNGMSHLVKHVFANHYCNNSYSSLRHFHSSRLSSYSASEIVNDGGSNEIDNADMIASIRDAVAKLCAQYPGEYWRDLDSKREYPTAFVKDMMQSGYLGIMIPTKYGGSGLNLTAACAVLEQVHRSGCNGGALHAQMYTMGTILKHGSIEQKEKWLPGIASGEIRLQAFGVSEPNNGTDTMSLSTSARLEGDKYIVNGQKQWTSRAEHSDLMVLLVRTASPNDDIHRTKALSVLLVDMRDVPEGSLNITPVQTMMNHSTTQIFMEDMPVPAENLIGGEGNGLKCILSSLNAERTLIAAECIGDGRYFVEKASSYAKERSVFGRPIGQNQGVQFPIAQAYARVEAAALMVEKAARLFDCDDESGAEANMAKLLAAEASWQAADMCIQTYGGYGFASEYDIERKFRETRLYKVAPISDNFIYSYLATKVLGLPRSF